ncbi:MAG: thioredoxin family protein [Clostridiales bacterium]|jgi:small redox-active disulfide protein 2|nr:thioredoxin family protein [Clostridiales bacterium]
MATVKILGSGCKKCDQLEANTKAVLAQLGIDATVEHERDFGKIAAYGVMSTPALVVNEKVLAYGKVLKPADIVKLLQKAGV